MKIENSIKELKKELEKISRKMNNKTSIFILVGFILALLSLIFLTIKVKNRLQLVSEDDDFYYDEDDFYEDYHALDYEDEE